MHPAFSIIAFTTASGAGLGLMALLAAFALAGLVPPDPIIGFVGLGLATVLVAAGLLSSTAHLGRPERAWRAFSQWRSSWLSREGVASVATLLAVAVLGIGWVFLGRIDGAFAVAAALVAVGAVITVATTAMIYASLKPIAQWHSPFTLPVYLLIAAMTGSVLLDALLRIFGLDGRLAGLIAAAAIVAAWAAKTAAWRHNDILVPATTANTATGLKGGSVRSVEWPHTEENYLLKEMGYRIARKHAAKLRLIAHLLAFAVPLALTLLALVAGGMLGGALAIAAVASQVPGVLVERWLFFAEAKHTVTLYYGR